MRMLAVLGFAVCGQLCAEVIVRPPQAAGPDTIFFPVRMQVNHPNVTAPIVYTEVASAEGRFLVNASGGDVDVRVLFGETGFIRREFEQMGLPDAAATTIFRLDIPELGYHVSDWSGFGIIPTPEPRNYPGHVPANTPLTFRVTARLIFNSGTPIYTPARFQGGLVDVIQLKATGLTFTPVAAVPAPGNLGLVAMCVTTTACGKWFLSSWFRK